MSPVHQVWPNHFARQNERAKKTRQTEEEVGRQHQRVDSPGVRLVPGSSGERGKMEGTGCKVICGALATLAFKGWVKVKVKMTGYCEECDREFRRSQ